MLIRAERVAPAPGSQSEIAEIVVAAAPFVLTITLQRQGYDVAVDIEPSRFDALIANSGCRVTRCNIEGRPTLRSPSGVYNFLVKGKPFSCVSGICEVYEKMSKIGHMDHVREYAYQEVSELVERARFSCRDVVCYGQFRRSVPR